MSSTLHFKESHRLGTKKALVDIDDTICFYRDKRRYDLPEPSFKNIEKINKLYEDGWHITYWSWGCKYHDLVTGTSDNPKPSFDLVIDDKAKRIEEV